MLNSSFVLEKSLCQECQFPASITASKIPIGTANKNHVDHSKEMASESGSTAIGDSNHRNHDDKKVEDVSQGEPPKMCDRCDMMQQRFNRLTISDQGDIPGKSVIHISAHLGHRKCALAAIASGTDVDHPDASDLTPLLIAAKKGNSDTVLALVESGADVHIDDINGHTALYFCAINGDVRAVHSLLEAGSSGGTPSSWYVSDLKIAMKQILTLSFNQSEHDGFAECVKLLGEYGVKLSELFDFKRFDPKADWDCYDWYDVFTSFPLGVLEQIVSVFHKEKACILHPMFTALLKIPNSTLLKSLLELDLCTEKEDGKTRILDPSNIGWLLVNLHHPESLGNLQIVLNHPDKNIKLNIDGKLFGRTALQWTCSDCNSVEVVKELLSHGANPDIGDEYVGGPLFEALCKMTERKAGMDIFICLLRYNCVLNKERYHLTGPQSLTEVTVLDLALLGCNLYAARILLLAGIQSWNWVLQGDPEKALLPDHIRCTEAERDAFIREHLHTPRPLYIQCRRKIRKILGLNADDKIASLYVADDIDTFLRYSDIDQIGEKFKNEFGEDKHT